jgi:hypothetical protein
MSALPPTTDVRWRIQVSIFGRQFMSARPSSRSTCSRSAIAAIKPPDSAGASRLLRCTTTVLNGKLDCDCDFGAGACHGVRNGDFATLSQLDVAKVYCPHCRQPHQTVGIEYWLSQVDEPTPLKETAEAA